MIKNWFWIRDYVYLIGVITGVTMLIFGSIVALVLTIH